MSRIVTHGCDGFVHRSSANTVVGKTIEIALDISCVGDIAYATEGGGLGSCCNIMIILKNLFIGVFIPNRLVY